MPPRNIPEGYILTKVASERFNRSHRQLNRDRVKAMNIGDGKVLDHFKLQIEDGQIFEGGELTVDQVSQLRDDGKNPVWFVEESWMEQTFGRKGEQPPTDVPPTPSAATKPTVESKKEGSQPSDSTPTSREVEILRDQLHREQEQNALLVEQLKIKDEQIKSGNDLARENQELTKQLHLLLANLQQSLTSGGALIAVSATPNPSRPAEPNSENDGADITDAMAETHSPQSSATRDDHNAETQKPGLAPTPKPKEKGSRPNSKSVASEKPRKRGQRKSTKSSNAAPKKTAKSSSKKKDTVLASTISKSPTVRFVSRLFSRRD